MKTPTRVIGEGKPQVTEHYELVFWRHSRDVQRGAVREAELPHWNPWQSITATAAMQSAQALTTHLL